MNKIRDLRVAANMTQADLAKILNCANTAVSKYEKEQLDLSSATISKLCDVFGCTADYLLGRSRVKTPALTEQEEQIISAWRRSDDRARDMVNLALAPFVEEDSSKKAI